MSDQRLAAYSVRGMFTCEVHIVKISKPATDYMKKLTRDYVNAGFPDFWTFDLNVHGVVHNELSAAVLIRPSSIPHRPDQPRGAQLVVHDAVNVQVERAE